MPKALYRIGFLLLAALSLALPPGKTSEISRTQGKVETVFILV